MLKHLPQERQRDRNPANLAQAAERKEGLPAHLHLWIIEAQRYSFGNIRCLGWDSQGPKDGQCRLSNVVM
jgi:hypothetical protein